MEDKEEERKKKGIIYVTAPTLGFPRKSHNPLCAVHAAARDISGSRSLSRSLVKLCVCKYRWCTEYVCAVHVQRGGGIKAGDSEPRNRQLLAVT